MRTPSIRTLSLLGFLLWGDVAYSQRYLTTFGTVTDLRAPHGALLLVQGDFNGDGTVDLLAQSPTRLLVYFQSASGDGWKSTSIPLARRVHAIVAGRCNRDRADDLVILMDDPLTVSVWIAGRRGGFSRGWQTPLGGQYDMLGFGDLNSDGKGDILVYGKKELGILAYLGRGDGTFQDPVTLLPEYSVGALAIADVNKDGLNDLFAANWLSNQVLVYENFGKLTFSEPTSLKLPFEPGLLCVARIDSDINDDLVVAGADRPVCRIFVGNGLGSYRPGGEVTFSSPPGAIFCADVNGDGANDLEAFCPGGRSLELALNDGSGRLEEHVTVAGGQQPADAVIFPQAPRGAPAAALLDGTVDKLHILASARRPHAPQADQLVLATGRRPEAAAIVDLNRDGRKDILVADAGSRDVAAYLNDSTTSITGFVPFGSGVNMWQLVHLWRRDGSLLVVSGAPDSDAIAVLAIDPKSFAHKTTLVPTAGRVEVLGAATNGGRLQIVGLEHTGDEHATLWEYDELDAGRFAERELLAGKGVMTAAVGAPDAEKNFLLAYMVRNRETNAAELYVSRNGNGGRPAASFVTEAEAHLWVADLNRDGQPDVVVHFGPPDNSLKFVFQGKDGWSAPVSLQSRIGLSSRDQLAFTDFNGDGITDIVVQNTATRTIDLLQARIGGSFLPPARLATAEGGGGFALGDLDGDGVPDLVITDAVNGRLRIISLGEH